MKRVHETTGILKGFSIVKNEVSQGKGNQEAARSFEHRRRGRGYKHTNEYVLAMHLAASPPLWASMMDLTSSSVSVEAGDGLDIVVQGGRCRGVRGMHTKSTAVYEEKPVST
jgi:hypothetical protein